VEVAGLLVERQWRRIGWGTSDGAQHRRSPHVYHARTLILLKRGGRGLAGTAHNLVDFPNWLTVGTVVPVYDDFGLIDARLP
jgi:hypothetical protein